LQGGAAVRIQSGNRNLDSRVGGSFFPQSYKGWFAFIKENKNVQAIKVKVIIKIKMRRYGNLK